MVWLSFWAEEIMSIATVPAHPAPSAEIVGQTTGALTGSGQLETPLQFTKYLGFGGLPLATVMITVLGIGFLIAESTALSVQGMRGVGIATIIILVASTVSSILYEERRAHASASIVVRQGYCRTT